MAIVGFVGDEIDFAEESGGVLGIRNCLWGTLGGVTDFCSWCLSLRTMILCDC